MDRFSLLAAALAACAVPAVAQTEWQRLPLLEHVRYPSLAFDLQRDVAVAFGGEAIDTTLGSTWIWDRTSWQRATPVHEPPPRQQAGMVFDAARGVVLLFGGRAPDNSYLGDTWSWDGVDWTQLAPPQSPSPRALPALVFDGARSEVLLFGGRSASVFELADTWAWDGVTWTQRTPAHQPPARSGAALAADVLRQRVVLFGGSCFQYGPCWRGDTWEWDGVDWTDRTPAWPSPSPPPRWSHGMVFDPARARTVLFGGSNEPGHYENDTWEWDGVSWLQRMPPAAPIARLGFGCDYDAGAQRVLVFGGEAWPGLLSDLWAFDGSTWQLAAQPMQPPLQVFSNGQAMAFDGDRGVVVWFGVDLGNGPMQTWEWDGARWLRRAGQQPGSSVDHRLRWLPARHRTVLYQPWRSWAPDQTWEYDGVQWAQVATAHWPRLQGGFDLALDPGAARLVLFGGRDVRGLSAITWLFDGVDWQWVAGGGPSAREGHAMALDVRRGKVVLFGGSTGTISLGDTFEWDGQQWTERQPATSPSPRSGHAMCYDLARRRIVLHGGVGVTGPLDDTWEWDGLDWRQRTTATTIRRVGHCMVHDFWRGETIANGDGGGTWRYAPQFPATFASFGSGCGGGVAVPRVWSPFGELPYSDGTFTLGFADLPGTSALLALGYSSTAWQGVPLPISMQPFGYPGCELLVAPEAVVALSVQGGVATWTLSLPPAPALVGSGFFAQALGFDPTTPPGIAMSPGAAYVIGGR